MTMTDTGPVLDLGDGQPAIPMDAEAVSELLADVIPARGSGGSGGHATGEFKPPQKVEPDSALGLFRPDPASGNVVVHTGMYGKLDDAAQRKLQADIMARASR